MSLASFRLLRSGAGNSSSLSKFNAFLNEELAVRTNQGRHHEVEDGEDRFALSRMDSGHAIEKGEDEGDKDDGSAIDQSAFVQHGFWLRDRRKRLGRGWEDGDVVEEEYDWEDEDDNKNATPFLETFGRIETNPVARESLLNKLIYQKKTASYSSPAIRRSRTSSPNGPIGSSPKSTTDTFPKPRPMPNISFYRR